MKIRTMNSPSLRHTLRVAFCLSLAASATVQASAQQVLGAQRRQASRPELEQAAQATENASAAAPDQKTREKLTIQAQAIRLRLKNGDFSPGDRILINLIRSDSALTDTFTVRNEQRLQLPGLPDISLRGVLDSELNSYLVRELARYLKNASVSATGLVRISVTGTAVRPGFYTVPVDMAVSDVVMGAGGPTQQTKLDDTIVRREGKTLLDKKQFAEAIRQGKTVGDMSMRNGDEILLVAPASTNGLTKVMAVIAPVTTLLWVLRR